MFRFFKTPEVKVKEVKEEEIPDWAIVKFQKEKAERGDKIFQHNIEKWYKNIKKWYDDYKTDVTSRGLNPVSFRQYVKKYDFHDEYQSNYEKYVAEGGTLSYYDWVNDKLMQEYPTYVNIMTTDMVHTDSRILSPSEYLSSTRQQQLFDRFGGKSKRSRRGKLRKKLKSRKRRK
jgi:hypothetical protein